MKTSAENLREIAKASKEGLQGWIWGVKASGREFGNGEVEALTKRAKLLNIPGHQFQKWMRGELA